MGYLPSSAALQSSLSASHRSLNSAIEQCEMSPPSGRLDLLRRFDDVFKETSAITGREKEEAFRLRYQVYCLDRGFEEADACPEGMEQDHYDSYAYHSLLRDRITQQALGTVRLIRPVAESNWLSRLPLAEYAHQDSLDELMRLPGGSTAEVSRFAIARAARKWLSLVPDTVEQAGDAPAPMWRQKLLPYMSLGLIRGLVRLSLEHSVTHWCLAAEPSLLRRLRTFGLHFKDAGPLVDHRGLRQVCYAELDGLLERAEGERPEFWEIMTQDGFLLPANATRNAA